MSTYDVVGVGANSTDFVYRLPEYPVPDGPLSKLRITSHERSPGGLARRRQRLEDEQCVRGEIRVLDRRHDLADDARQLHGPLRSRVPDFNRVDDADDGGVDRTVLEA